MTSATLADTNSTVVVTLSGVDETVTQMMYARHSYAPRIFSGIIALSIWCPDLLMAIGSWTTKISTMSCQLRWLPNLDR